jgi:hypothetical protein
MHCTLVLRGAPKQEECQEQTLTFSTQPLLSQMCVLAAETCIMVVPGN